MTVVREAAPVRPAAAGAARWWGILRRAHANGGRDNIGVLAGGVAFSGFVALFPALIALVSLYGLVADPAQAASTLEGVGSALPATARPLVAEQLRSITAAGTGELTLGLVVSALAALVSASSGTQKLMTAVNVASAQDESRGAIRLRLRALALTVGAVLFVVAAIALVAVAPFVLDLLGPGGRLLGQVARWTLLEVIMVLGLAVLYRTAPDRAEARLRWLSAGSVAATLLWTLGSVGFGVYVDHLAAYNATYGTLAGVVVLLLWLHLTSYVVLLGAEIDAEARRSADPC